MPEFLIDIEIACALVYFTTLSFLMSGFLRLKPKHAKDKPSVTVIVAAHNEEQNIASCIESLRQQSYAKENTEIILVDDRSSDSTGNIMLESSRRHSSLKVLRIDNTPPGTSPKKYALEQAIRRASGDLIFITDADCTPPEKWLERSVPYFTDHVGVVIGPAPLQPSASGISKVLALNYYADAFLAAGAAGWNIAVTCTGRNLAYRKSVFEAVDGFQAIKHSLSGDDDLFLQEVKKQTDWNITFSLDHTSAVPSPAAKRFSDFVHQRKRHVSASRHYTKPLQTAFLIFNIANLYLFAFLFLAISLQDSLKLAILILTAKLAADFSALFAITNKLHHLSHLRYFPHWEIFYLFNQVVISPLGFFGKIKWHAR